MKCISVLTMALLVAACAGGDRAPEAPLNQAKFEQVLAGSLLIEARTKQELQVDVRSNGSTDAAYAELFKEHGVTEADFKATYDAYLKQPELLKEVYQDVLNQLQQRADSARQ